MTMLDQIAVGAAAAAAVFLAGFYTGAYALARSLRGRRRAELDSDAIARAFRQGKTSPTKGTFE